MHLSLDMQCQLHQQRRAASSASAGRPAGRPSLPLRPLVRASATSSSAPASSSSPLLARRVGSGVTASPLRPGNPSGRNAGLRSRVVPQGLPDPVAVGLFFAPGLAILAYAMC
ncbi:hypothetical protein CHLRE_01g027575v5 [Chlamydomonas reinhardtii]|uniref:Uncharacterized protein n=1 Tax=Chlamydomonas reinhardtii TaxID=3055 RepID=A0A2K3E6I8_CHLRE|nr:uncharacterized protein CHLRE_01g027575v5 [Chlamydomonas reinhardtii]PNW88396.1 hypothetical protein CHLRE_01g027575v5 [Chlamydomonas reinhardtii]